MSALRAHESRGQQSSYAALEHALSRLKARVSYADYFVKRPPPQGRAVYTGLPASLYHLCVLAMLVLQVIP